jgi:hypothetical protein
VHHEIVLRRILTHVEGCEGVDRQLAAEDRVVELHRGARGVAEGQVGVQRRRHGVSVTQGADIGHRGRPRQRVRWSSGCIRGPRRGSITPPA